ncbi:VCBS repeat-containing protein [Streptomyces sp. NA04227]|uniref:SpvB/TcaC N-terminal domain-containing protein n=1 Tax=Streptomyces sp. NA04227 TaxID=2742136 RepID=UPI001591D1A6|nr:SpvB/TcaC N-terminal domain-containing protein [Streptomyces sp. NA04227]QKW06065.1 VCBS repeat-containing protein [Streptomyces sp. NA04227]
MGDTTRAPESIVGRPTGGGALHGIGEKFSADLHTGTANFTLPLSLPPGRGGFQPQVSLVYSTGHGNGLFGMGWKLTVPGISRKTSRGVPRYRGDDVFVLSGAEDLTPVAGNGPGPVTYRPRTEEEFSRIERFKDGAQDYWEVRAKDGTVTRYGTRRPAGAPAGWKDPAVTRRPGTGAERVFAWHPSRTTDPFGNTVRYRYEQRDAGSAADAPHSWDQPLLTGIDYADQRGTDQQGTDTDMDADASDETRYAVHVTFFYTSRTDPFSEYRAGFEIRTSRLCSRILVETDSDAVRPWREYGLGYRAAEGNGVSLLSSVQMAGFDDAGDRAEELPPLSLGYLPFDPERRRFAPVRGQNLPAHSLADPSLELVDLFGTGLPDIVELSTVSRYWRNRGDGSFALPTTVTSAPSGTALTDNGVQLLDAEGNGRSDLLVARPGQTGYFPMRFGGLWDGGAFRSYSHAPSFGLKDPNVRLIDLDGDGVTDAIRSGTRLECFFQDPDKGWDTTRVVDRDVLDGFPAVDFDDPRVKWADLTGDGLQDIALVNSGSFDYWPQLGRGDWGPRIRMRPGPDFAAHVGSSFDPRRVLLGDVDGDGLADLVYAGDGKVLVWLNQSGNGWSEDPYVITGTPRVGHADAVRMTDVLGSGAAGVFWTADATAAGGDRMWFLDLTGGRKPYLLTSTDNNLGAVTTVRYAPSTLFCLRDRASPATRWRTPLPFPVQVVHQVEVTDQVSGSRLTTEYAYHHGYWDGSEREFRGFGMVEQRDTETFEDYHRADEGQPPVRPVDPADFAPPVLRKTWFHQGAVGDEDGAWAEADHTADHWPGDTDLLGHRPATAAFLASLPAGPGSRRAKRDALRALRGKVLRTELYALDGSAREGRPYTVTECAWAVDDRVTCDDGTRRRLNRLRPGAESEDTAGDRPRPVYVTWPRAERTTYWERGDDPRTELTFTGDPDAYGEPVLRVRVGCPRGWRTMDDTSDAYLTVRERVHHARPDDIERHYLADRVAARTTYELRPSRPMTVRELFDLPDSAADHHLIGQTLTHYDGEAFTGLPLGRAGTFGAPVRTEQLTVTDDILRRAYGDRLPPYLTDGAPGWSDDYPEGFRALLAPRAGLVRHGPDGVATEGWFARTRRLRYDFQEPGRPVRGLVTAERGPLGTDDERDTEIAYEPLGLLPAKVTDAAGLTVEVAYDPRTLQPRTITDHNGALTRYTYTPIGLLASSTISGTAADGSPRGDREQPSEVLDYDFRSFRDRAEPVHVHTTRRVHHDPAAGSDTVESREFSDGFGRLVQLRVRAEDVRYGDDRTGDHVIPADQTERPAAVEGRRRADGDPPHVVVSGLRVYDNKGRVLDTYEQFFDTGWSYRRPDPAGGAPRTRTLHDPCGRLLRTVHPDGSQQFVVMGRPASLDRPESAEPSPWESFTYDANDNAGRTHPDTSAGFRHHHDTPHSVVTDALGRTVETVERGREPGGPVQEMRTRTRYDIRGNPLAVTDALDRTAVENVYDLAGQCLRSHSIDSGTRQTVYDAEGRPVEQRDGRGALVLSVRDVLGRLAGLWARDTSGEPTVLRERVEYGDGGSPAQPPAERRAQALANRLGRPHRYFDEAGLLTYDAYDFKGNVTSCTRRVIKDSVLAPGWRTDWDRPKAQESLESSGYRTATTFDALNRITSLRYPQDVEGTTRLLRAEYTAAGALARLTLDGQPYVREVAYNARGQRTFVIHGNGVMTALAHDPRTARRQRLWTGRVREDPATPLAHVPENAAKPLQDIGYAYDLIGNVTAMRERSPGCGIPPRPDALDRLFEYDAIGRLLSATGREADRPGPPQPWAVTAPHHDATLTRAYQQTFAYDAVGNLERLRHAAGDSGSFTRTYRLEAGANRLEQVAAGTREDDYLYDANGNLLRENGSRHFTWNHADLMTGFSVRAGDGPASVEAVHLYGADGTRVKKLVRKNGGSPESTVYVDGVFEHHRRGGGENNTLHIPDGDSRVALIRVGPAFAGDGASDAPVTYHFDDHLGSSAVVAGGADAASGAFMNREEYSPYGETSFGSFARKRYRFTAKERDEESGLAYHGARYYAPWLARWTSPDPAGLVDGPGTYTYVRGRPVSTTDTTGTQGTAAPNTVGNQCLPMPGLEPDRGIKNMPQAGPDPGGIPYAEIEARGRAMLETLKIQTQSPLASMVVGTEIVMGEKDPEKLRNLAQGSQALEQFAQGVAGMGTAAARNRSMDFSRAPRVGTVQIRTTQQTVQAKVSELVRQFHANPVQLAEHLSAKELNDLSRAAFQFSSGNSTKAEMTRSVGKVFGKAVERAAVDWGKERGIVSVGQTRDAQGRFTTAPDLLVTTGPDKGMKIEITTYRAWVEHAEREWGLDPSVEYATYEIQYPSLFRFLGVSAYGR